MGVRRGRGRSDTELLRRADAAAFGEFYARHERAVLVFMLRRTSSPEVAAALMAAAPTAVAKKARRPALGR